MKCILWLMLLLAYCHSVCCQVIKYGDNPIAGRYIDVGDAKLYYEIYGAGKPLLLLHGDTFGYIAEFGQYIPMLASHFKVIAVGMRGHGKSELGNKTFSYQLFAEDALKVLQQEKADSVMIVGFSAGATIAYYLAAHFPKSVKKVVAMGGAIDTTGYRPGVLTTLKQNTGDDYEKMLPQLVKERKQLMPKPDSYNELIERLKYSWLQPSYVSIEALRQITCPVLTVGGDRDNYLPVEEFIRIFRLIPSSQLAIIPKCNHVGLILKPEMFSSVAMPFLLEK